MPKRQRTEHEKRPRTVDTEENDSPSEDQLPGPKNDQSEPEVDLPVSEYDPLEPLDDSDSYEETSDKEDSSGGGTGNRSGEVRSTGGGSGNGIGSSGGNGSGSSGTCASSHISMSRGGTGSASEAGLSGVEYGPLESNDEDRLSATEPVRKNQAGEDAEAKV